MSNEFDPNPYDNVSIDEALTQIYERCNDRTIRQIVTMLKKATDTGGGGNVYEQLEAGSNITIEETSDGKAKISASGEVSSVDIVAREAIAAIKDGTNLDSFGDVETALDDKADKSTTYTKTEVDTALGDKADKSATYTKTEVDNALDDKQDTISDLDTIRSGAAAGATAVQPETGKGLSTNDYTNAEKTKLEGIAEGAEVNEITGIKVNNTTVNPDANKVVNITIPVEAADVDALPDTTKYAAALSLTIDSTTFVITAQLKDQNGDNLGTAQTIDLPLESVVVNGSYNSATKKVILTLQSGSTVEFSVADLVSGLQSEITSVNKLDADLVDDSVSANKFVTSAEKTTWNDKQDAIPDLSTIRSGASAGTTAVQPSTLNNYQTLLSSSNKLNPSYISYDSTHRAVTDTEKSTWNSKQTALTTAQLNAINSGINSTKVGQIATNASNISSLQTQMGDINTALTNINAALGGVI